MKWLPKGLGLPLLVKELVEQAARRRTYLVRVVYAALLFLAFGAFFRVNTERFIGNAMSVMGCGRDLLYFVVWIQIAGICLFLPAMMSGVLTYEKERRSLELLFLTDLGPWEILLQKYLGRRVPMFTFLLLSLPLMGVAYSLGGVTMEELAAGVYWLVVTCLGVGAFALMVSAYCRTSVQAFVATYGVGALLTLLGLGPMMAPFIFFFMMRTGSIPSVAGPMIGPGSVTRGASLEQSVLMGIPTLIWTAVCLALARVFLVSRASVRPRSITLKVFGAIDRLMKDLNVITGNIVLIKDMKTLPADEPIAWREMTKKALGKPRYLFRIFVAIEIPTVLIALGTVRIASRGSSEGLTWMLFVLWILAALAISVPSANAIIAERTNRSLEALLVTPMTGAEIIRQKARGVSRLIYVFMVAFFTVILTEAYWESGGYSAYRYRGCDLGTFGYLVASTLSVLIYLPMLSWVSRWLGLTIRSRSRAVLTTVGALIAWTLGPLALVAILSILTDTTPEDTGLSYLMLLSPATIIPLVEYADSERMFHNVFMAPAGWVLVLNFALYGAVLYVFRRLCLTRADRYLGRVGPSPNGDSHHGGTETRRTA